MASVYALGSNGSGQLGIGHKEDVSVPKQVIFTGQTPTSITQIAAGGNHTLLLSSGVLYGAGDFSTGACGLFEPGKLSPIVHAVQLGEENSPITKAPVVFCAATWEASFIVQQNESGWANQIYSFGTGNKGELGQGELIFRSSKPLLLENFPPKDVSITDLAASLGHVVAVLSNGDVYGWGNGRKGQLGPPNEIVYTPRKILGLEFKVVHAVCGREFTCLFGEPENGKVIILGSDKWGIISAAPRTCIGWKDARASWGAVFVLQQDKSLCCWGRDDHGQLPPDVLPPLEHISVGSEHALGLTTDGKVLAWGWGEHGNCGPNTIEGDVKGRWNVIASSEHLPPKSNIFSIGAGCASSWICIKEN